MPQKRSVTTSKKLTQTEYELFERLLAQCNDRRIKGCDSCPEKPICLALQGKVLEFCRSMKSGVIVDYDGNGYINPCVEGNTVQLPDNCRAEALVKN